MKHLWIDLELLRSHAKEDGSSKHPFRFQKRVSGRGPFGLPDQPDSFNVGHFSVRPDFGRLLLLPMDEVIPYVLSLRYRVSPKQSVPELDAVVDESRQHADQRTQGKRTIWASSSRCRIS